MKEQKTVWTEDWRSRLEQILKHKGYKSLLEYLKDNPATTYIKLAEQLGPFAALQLEQVQMEEAVANNYLREAAMDALVRIINDRLKRGWGVGRHCELNTAGIYADWLAILEHRAKKTDLRKIATNVWNTIEFLPPSKGWLPKSTNDKIIQEAFKRHWCAGPVPPKK